MGSGEAARADLEAALNWRLDAQDSNGVADCLRALAAQCLRQGALTEAQLHLEHAVFRYDQIGNGPGRAATLILLGDVHERDGRYEAARNCWREALQVWERIGHQGWADDVRARLAG